MDTPESIANLKKSAERCGLADVIPVACVTAGRSGREPVNFIELHEEGVSAFSDDGDPVHNSGLLLEALDAVNEFDGVIIEHPEVKELAGGSVNSGSVSLKLDVEGIPSVAETADIARCMEIASNSRGHLHLTHLSLPRSIELAREECFNSANVTIDVTPHHIALNENALMEHGTLAKMNPPLRSLEQMRRLGEMVRDGMVDAIASDHAPHVAYMKDGSISEAAFGITGLETLLPITLEVLTGLKMPVIRILHLLTCGPARALGITAPGLTPGLKADCVLFDPEIEYRLSEKGSFSRSANTPFHGFLLHVLQQEDPEENRLTLSSFTKKGYPLSWVFRALITTRITTPEKATNQPWNWPERILIIPFHRRRTSLMKLFPVRPRFSRFILKVAGQTMLSFCWEMLFYSPAGGHSQAAARQISQRR